MSFRDSEADRQADILGYAEASQRSAKMARGLEIAAIIIEAVDIDVHNPTLFRINDALRQRGLMREGDTLDSVQQEAVGVVKSKAAFEQRIADDCREVSDSLR